jgi:hypothetical protein
MIARRQSAANSIARTSLAFYIRDQLRAAIRLVPSSSSCTVIRVPVRTRCRTRRFHRGAGESSTSSWRTTWQQRRDAVASRRLRKPHARGAKRPVAQQPAREHARVRGRRRLVLQLASAGSALSSEAKEKAGDVAGFFAFTAVTASSERSPAARSARLAPDIPSRLSAPRARTRSFPRGSSSDSPRSRRSPPRR